MTNTTTKKPKSDLVGLLAILAGIVLGVIFGLTYGETVWLASDGPQMRQQELLEAQQQRQEKAAALQKKSGASEELAQVQRQQQIISEEIAANDALIAETTPDHGSTSYEIARYVGILTKFLGDLFLQALTLLVIPLVFVCMVGGVAGLGDLRSLERTGGWTMAYYFVTCGIAVFIGIALVLIIQPGVVSSDSVALLPKAVNQMSDSGAFETFLDVFRGSPDRPGSGLIPSNIFLAAANTNVLGLIFFGILFGGILASLGERGKPVANFFHILNDIMMAMVRLVMFCAPVGIFGLVAAIFFEQGGSGFLTHLSQLGWYSLTVILGLAIHAAFLSSLLPVLAKRNPFAWMRVVAKPLATAFGTSSSVVTLPVSAEAIENAGVSEETSGFVLPLGATINMDGTALYEAVAAIFIAQMFSIELTFAQLLVIFFTATLAAIGAAGIPQAGLVTMVVVLTAVGLPLHGIGAILAVDWFLDRLRTTVNVYGDTVGAAIIETRVRGKTHPCT